MSSALLASAITPNAGLEQTENNSPDHASDYQALLRESRPKRPRPTSQPQLGSRNEIARGSGAELARLYLARDLAAGVDPGVAVGEEREVDGVEEAILEDPGEAVHHEARRVGAQRLVVERHGHLPRPLVAGRRGRGGRQQEEEERGDGGETGGHRAGSRCRREGRRGEVK